MDAVSLVGTIGLSMAAAMLVCLFIGREVDKILHSSPWGLIIGVIVGMIAGFWGAYKRIKEIESDQS